jgi:hypothetical protein
MLKLSPAAAQRHEWLTIHPLLSPDETALGYDLLASAIAAGTLTITELGSATVPELAAINEGDRDVLILDGEQFIGARQNRMASRSILLPAHSKTTIPVNCMEQGRWHSVGDHFAPSPVHSPSTVRQHNKHREAAYARMGVEASPAMLRESQGEVWSEIAHLASDLDTGSGTGALNEIVGGKADDLKAWAASFPSLPGQVGVLAFIGTEPLGLDVVGDAGLYARLHDRLIGGYVQDALRVRGNGDQLALERGAPDPEAVQAFLGGVRTATRVGAPTVGRGAYYVLTGEVTGGELEDEERTVHLSAFPLIQNRQTESAAPAVGPLAPPSFRRRVQ